MRSCFNRTHEFLMFPLRVIDQGHSGLGDIGEVADFTRMIHAQFEDSALMEAVHAKQREGQANIVVEISSSGKPLIFT